MRAGVPPARVFEQLRAHGAEADDVEIGSTGTSVVTHPGPSAVAASIGRSLGVAGIVLPILEPERSRIPA